MTSLTLIVDGAAAVLAGVEIPSASPVFLTIVGLHVLVGLVCVVTGVVAMLSSKRPGRHPAFGISDAAALPRRARHLDAAAKRLNDAMDHGETERTAFVCR